VVLPLAASLVWAGRDVLVSHRAVRPMWTSPNAVAIARRQLAAAEAAARALATGITTMEDQVYADEQQAYALQALLARAGFGFP
jgi:hypothetical protein